jgi:proteasome lid subunit RPN8/RPN11
MVSLTDPIHILPDHWRQMLEHVSHLEPEEACGLVAGMGRVSICVYAIDNYLHSAVRFQMEPQQQVDAILEIEEKGWDLLGIYHSHPNGPPMPSPTDVAGATYEDAVNLIWSKHNGVWTCRAFLIQDHQVTEIPIITGEQD